MKHTKHFVWLISLFIACTATAQNPGTAGSKALTVDDLVQWKRITGKIISDNGKWAACRMAPWEGDATVTLYNADGRASAAYTPAADFAFSASSAYLIVKQTPPRAQLDSLKLRKTKANKMPMNRLVIRAVAGTEEIIDSVRNYRLAETADWIAYQCGRKDSALYVRSLDGRQRFRFPDVNTFGFARKSARLFYISQSDTTRLAETGADAAPATGNVSERGVAADADIQPGLYVWNPDNGVSTLIKPGKGVFKQTAFDETGGQIAFLYCADKDSADRASSLWLSEGGNAAREIAVRHHPALPAGWVFSPYGALAFSPDGKRLFFGTAPAPRQKDTTRLAEYRPEVQVWSWDEPVQYTVQQYNKKRDSEKSYRAVYNLPGGQLYQLATPEIPDIQLGDRGNAALALLSTSLPYSLSAMWEGRTRSDYYVVSLETGERRPVRQADYARYRLSPGGRYAYTYADTDSSWYTLDLSDGQRYRLTTPQTFPAWDEDNDVPDYPSSYGLAGWTADDRYILLYDRYDMWRFDPKGASAPVNLTVDGRKKLLSYRWEQLDPEARFIDASKPQIVSAFSERTKETGYYRARFSTPAVPEALLAGAFEAAGLAKARKADAVLYTKETFEEYPDVYLADLSFRRPVRLTHGGDQQAGFRWGTAELVSWLSLDGVPLQGVLYKPAGFDPAKKYPLLVNFYERNSDLLYRYHMPEPHRSTIDYHLYNSNGYIIFNPDVRYLDGYPGQSAYNCVMPGITMLLGKGFIDEKAIGAQGHSWGGYQVAYLATRTNLFAAIESGAPVVNMFSAYGGIRWGSGMNRSFQYEHQQSRIGGTPWSAPLQYLENSPLFTMDKVETPILIMHNDADGHVPWYQGIEYFVALKRLGKPSWLLNYPGEPHWPMRMANRIDFQRRMLQFFDHYLKKEPAPRWMTEGVRAVDQPFELGY